MTLSDDELERYARHIVLPELGGAGQARLKATAVAVVGAGGIGSAVIPTLAGAGVGRLSIIDDDVVDRSNLQRQPIYRDDQVGREKAPLAAAFVRALNPHVEVIGHERRIVAENVEELLHGHDLVIDGCDNFATRLVVADACTRLRVPLLSAAIARFQGQVGLFRGWEADKPCYRCFVGDAFDSDTCDTCAEVGVLGALVGTVGNFAALAAVRAIAGVGEDIAGKLFVFDGLSLTLRAIRLPKDPGCRVCANQSSPHGGDKNH